MPRPPDRSLEAACAPVQTTPGERDAHLDLIERIAGIGSWEIDLVTERMYWSRELCRIHGVTSDTAPRTQHDFRQMVHPDDLPFVDEGMSSLVPGETTTAEFRVVRRDGAVRLLQAHALLVADAEGRYTRVLGTSLDVTERRATEQALRASEHAERANRAKSEFLSRMSHELRTPLNSSRGASDFVTKPFDAPEVLLRVEHLLDARVLHLEERAARARAEEATRERERLLAVVAHDLRNPLAVVSMYAETLLLQGLDPGALPEDGDAAWGRTALATIHANTMAMQRLVEDLLDASSIRGDGLRIHREARRVGDVFECARTMLSPLAETAGVALAFVGDEDSAETMAEIDGERVVQLLSNLVGNAVKFTPRGGSVGVQFCVRDDVLHASVADTGPGIAADELPHLFAAFWTGVRRDGMHSGHGAGLGLWIARGIVEAHGGTLRAESTPGAGATFRFTLPLVAPRAATLDALR